MTIFDLTWHPSRISEGMIAKQKLADGTIVFVRFEDNTYHLTLFGKDNRVTEDWTHLNRQQVNAHLASIEFVASHS
jgi:hypothetical protein